MGLRIAFDLDGTLADMESELVRQAEALFREVVDRRPRDVPASGSTAGQTKSAGDSPVDPEQAAAESSSENASPLTKLNLTAREQRRLWKHVESIPDFWLTLNELEPGVIRRLAMLAVERRWEIAFL